MSGPVWSDLQEARRHSVLPVNRTILGCLGLWHSNVFRQVQVQFLPASVRALNRACYVKKAKQIALNRSFKCDHRALSDLPSRHPESYDYYKTKPLGLNVRSFAQNITPHTPTQPN